MHQLKIKPLVITFIIAIIVFITTGFTYQYLAQKKPLDNALNQLELSTMTFPVKTDDKDIYVEIMPKKQADLDEAVQEVYAILNQYQYGNDNIHVSIRKSQGSSLDEIWKTQLFSISEAMASQNYSAIPELMANLEKQHPELTTQANIDSQYVYITLKKDQEVKYVLLPLTLPDLEAWNNA